MFDPNRNIWQAAWLVNSDVIFESDVSMSLDYPRIDHELNDHCVPIDTQSTPKAELLNLFFAKKQPIKILSLKLKV
jgi:hypothetical protein